MAILFPNTEMTQAQLFGAYVIPPFDSLPCNTPSTVTSNPTIVTVFKYGAFKRLWVSYFFRDTSTITWELERGFEDPGPYSFQLQGSHGGTPRADDWFNIGSPTSSFFTTDSTRRMYGKSATLYYRVLLTTDLNCYVSPIIDVLGTLNKHDWLIVREFLRKEQLHHRLFSSEKGYLLKARRFGPECTNCRYVMDCYGDKEITNTLKLTNEVANTSCTQCYGTGFISGYYPPTEYYALVNGSSTREFRDMKTGTAKAVVVQGRFLGTLPLVQGDVWISDGSDDRYYIHSVNEASVWKSVPVVYIVELRLAPFTDVIYEYPLNAAK